MKITADRKRGLVTVSINGVSETITRRELLSQVGIPSPWVKTSKIVAAFSNGVEPKAFRELMLGFGVPKGSVSKMEQVLEALYDERLTKQEVRKSSLNWAYSLIKKEIAK